MELFGSCTCGLRAGRSPRNLREKFLLRRGRINGRRGVSMRLQMEYHCTKSTDVAIRIFERAHMKFPTEEELALRYLGFLISINDDSNARAFFERAVSTFRPEKARVLWDRWTRYEYHYGSLQAAQDLEKKIAEIYPNEPPIKRFADRHKYLNVDTIAVRDLGFKFNRQSIRTSAASQQITPTSSQELPGSQESMASSSKRPSSAPTRDSPAKKLRPFASEPTRTSRGKENMSEDRELKPVPSCPAVVSRFLSMLPEDSSFEGPWLSADDMMRTLRNAVIPSSTGITVQPQPPRPSPPAASMRASRSASGGRPPPPGSRRRY